METSLVPSINRRAATTVFADAVAAANMPGVST